MRIVSLLPSATELVCAIGLQSSLVGVSHECDFPPEVQNLPRVTRTKLHPRATSAQIDQLIKESVQSQTALFELDRDLILELRPDLIISQNLCNVCAVSQAEVQNVVDALGNNAKVLWLHARNLDEVMESIGIVGNAANASQPAQQLQRSLRARVNAVRERVESLSPTEPKPTVLLLEWLDPLYNGGHWNPELIELAGGIPVLCKAGEASQKIEWSDVLNEDPDVLLIACCGYSIDRAMDDIPSLVSLPRFGQLRCVDTGQVYLADGSQYFNRPGPRLVDTLELLAHTLHPTQFALPQYVEATARLKRAS